MTNKRNDAPACVLKLGGSLLDLPELAQRLLHVIDSLKPVRTIVVVGGGENADLVRKWDKQFHFDDAVAHDLAVHAMSLNARMVSKLHPRFRFSSEIRSNKSPCSSQTFDDKSTEASHCSTVTIVDSAEALTQLESSCHASLHVRRSWDVTSDSIAAWMAHRLNADRLILLKSCEPPVRHVAQPAATGVETDSPESARTKSSLIASTIERLGAHNLVDADFGNHATLLPHLGWCNLRSPDLRRSALPVTELW